MSSPIEPASASKSSVAITDLVRMATTLNLGRFSGDAKDFPTFRMDTEMVLDGFGLKSLLYDTSTCEAMIPVSRVLTSALYKALPTMRPRISVLPKFLPTEKPTTGLSAEARVMTLYAAAGDAVATPEFKNVAVSATVNGEAKATRLAELALHVSGLVLPCDIWGMVVNDYDRNTGIHRSVLRMKMHGLRMTESFQTFKTELEVMCCQLATMGSVIDEGEKLAILFRGVASNPSAAAAIPECELLVGKGQKYLDICAYLDMYFALRAAVRMPEAVIGQRSVSVLAAQAGTGVPKPRCVGCGKKGHLVESCWTVHPELKPTTATKQTKKKSGQGRQLICFECGEAGHKRAVCPNTKPKIVYPTKASDASNERKANNSQRLVITTPGPFTAAPANTKGPVVAAVRVAPVCAAMQHEASGLRDPTFYIDTAADVHVCNDTRRYMSMTALSTPLSMYAFDGSRHEVTMTGMVWLQVLVGGRSYELMIEDVLFDPCSDYNLLSESLLAETYDSRLLRNKWTFADRKTGRAVLSAERRNRRWAIISDPTSEAMIAAWPEPEQPYRRTMCVSTIHSHNKSQTMGLAASSGRATLLTWHARLGHMSMSHMLTMLKQGLVVGLGHDIKQVSKHELECVRDCDICLRCKSNRLPFVKDRRLNHASRCLERLWIDLSGRFPVPSIDDEYYYLSITDEFSHYITVYMLKHKSESLKALQGYVRFWKTRRPKDAVMFIRSDNGGEFTSAAYKDWCADNGVLIEYTVPGCPQQNGLSERVNQTIMKPARSMLKASNVPAKFWSFAVKQAVAVLNMSPTNAVESMTSSEILLGKVPSVFDLRVFGCLAYYIDANERMDKLSERAHRCVYLGVDSQSAGSVLWHIAWQAAVIGKHVRYVENEFPEPCPTTTAADAEQTTMSSWLDSVCEDLGQEVSIDAPVNVNNQDLESQTESAIKYHAEVHAEVETGSGEDAVQTKGVRLAEVLQPAQDSQASPLHALPAATPHSTSTSSTASALSPALPSVPTESVVPALSTVPSRDAAYSLQVPERLRIRSKEPGPVPRSQVAVRRPVTRSQTRCTGERSADIVESAEEYEDLLQAMQTSMKESKHPSNKDTGRVCATVVVNGQPLDESVVAEALQQQEEPTTAKEALASPESVMWRQAMQEELDSMDAHGVWVVVPPPVGHHTVSCRWVFKRKLGADGKIERYRARLVARGFEQKCGVNYDETWAPTALFKTYRLVLALSGYFALSLYQLDVQSAYLNGALTEEVYMAIPEGCEDNLGRVCRLRKAIYGLKQAARSWYEELSRALLKFGLARCIYDPCLYSRIVDGHIQIVLVYVDDICDATSHMSLHDELVSYLNKLYGVTDKGMLSWFLNHSVIQTSSSVRVHQQNYIDRILAKFPVLNGHRISTPMDPEWIKNEDETKRLSVDQHGRYRQLVGCLMYLSVATRPDICFAVGECARHVAAPTERHMMAAIRVLQYVSVTRALMLEFKRPTDLTSVFSSYPVLTAYTDASWASDKDTLRSVSGFVLRINSSPVDWSSHMQAAVAGSSHDAELIALAACVANVQWFRGLLGELLTGVIGPLPAWRIFCDNKGSIESVYRGPLRQHKRVIGVKIAVVRDAVAAEEVSVAWCATTENTADVLTKALMKGNHERHGANLVISGDVACR